MAAQDLQPAATATPAANETPSRADEASKWLQEASPSVRQSACSASSSASLAVPLRRFGRQPSLRPASACCDRTSGGRAARRAPDLGGARIVERILAHQGRGKRCPAAAAAARIRSMARAAAAGRSASWSRPCSARGVSVLATRGALGSSFTSIVSPPRAARSLAARFRRIESTAVARATSSSSLRFSAGSAAWLA